jgi:dTDP-4-amino-4,6-dideoxygalactose transaminase
VAHVPPWPNFSEKEGELVKEVLLSNKVNYWTGAEAREFEKEYAGYFGSRYSIALANGTVAIDLALIALGIGQGDDVIVTPRSFVASASTVVNCGAKPVFADIDADSQNITAETVARAITPNTKAIICVHLAGWPCEMDAIMQLAEERNLVVIEDCAQAHGATYRGQSVGTIGEVGAWSFCQDKIMTTGGEGGMITLDDEKLYQLMWSFKDHGKSFTKVNTPNPSTGFRYIHDTVGTNWRLTEMQAALGRYQLTQLDDWVGQRRRNVATFNHSLAEVDGIRLTIPPKHINHACYKYYFFTDPGALKSGWDRDRVVAEIVERGVKCFTGACPEIYREEAFTGLYGEHPVLPVAASLGTTSVMFNVHPGITPEHCENAADVIREVFALATR